MIDLNDLKPGEFSGNVKAEWLDDSDDSDFTKEGRDMRLLEDFYYRDLSGKLWSAFKASIINGASIPKFFWGVIGSPFVGKYRRPTVIHDVYCNNHLRSAKETHDVFLEMMQQANVSKSKAEKMYFAVDKFGPRW